MKRAGRPKKPTSEKIVIRNISFTPESNAYILKIIEDRKMEIKGSLSKIVNEIIQDHHSVKRYKETQKQILEEKLAHLK